ncbi:probable RNA methyltransferase CG11342 isoform X2 [Thrips palmi]|nr:probable RNA methyltransferase CG11342 isoform X2 [Thrips palmi]XP_034230988.1 probable RNA methyltransferase CG11342 isoform X2 [Thrips palmi]XP_034230989.1 probable RNA methyltransferase CG11342 isoform X2 [Thrips palmi]XP_034230991.1 probable RNA methyltransferase CG11342 isoform X2 [Thrips palmi]XP_034230992.1 probable RNA methyltransferase CG11342 isoform X2 [Thrips palmi]XP_034230993.1 probable RNA methyltransferase CG11342 isoform X2 [Thrips palmi]XP_034230994.1 probable RNA methylt
MDRLQFNGDDPGAVLLGNFINYYEFHPPEERLKLLPSHLWETKGNEPYTCLDIGCNSGDLTSRVYECITNSFASGEASPSGSKNTCSMLGIDVDPVLIERAQEKNKYVGQITYKCVDFMDDNKSEVIRSHLANDDARFDVIFCFSVTMWIHLNHGDNGLNKFLREISEMSKMLVLEPQPWKCYKSAVKRLKRCNKSFPYFQKLSIRENVEEHIEQYLLETCNFHKVYESPDSKWGRKLMFFKGH